MATSRIVTSNYARPHQVARSLMPIWSSGATRASSTVVRQPQDGIWTPRGSTIENRSVILELEDGLRLNGVSFGAEKDIEGEVVFSTGMVGYVENLTDPSYQGQFLVSTFPLVGNYGVPRTDLLDKYGLPDGLESMSGRIHASAFIAQDYSHHYYHWNADKSLSQWLIEEGVPGISGIDTRMLTKRIRERGAMKGRIVFENNCEVGSVFGQPIPNPSERNLVAEVSTPEVKVWNKGGDLKVVCVDFGMKANMIRHLVDRNCEVIQVPWNYDYSGMEYDGLFLSNGPGDPGHLEMLEGPEKILRKVIKQSESVPDAMAIPIFGICMGNQVLGRAVGCTTYKMPFGNRGQNQPVTNHVTNECYVTPQNHGFAIDTTNLPKGWNPLFTNTNDGTNEGIAHETKPWCTAQFHPESRSGPTDTAFLFDLFVKNMQERKTGDGARSFPEMFRQHDNATRGGRLLGHAAAAKIAADAPPVKKILMLGSGGLSIGQAGEFDYSGSQAIKAFKEEGIEVVLVNPNIASVQTNDKNASDFQADTVYFLPVTHDYVEEIIKREKPDGIVLSMGGQTGLNTGVELYNRGTLDKYNCRVLGTSVAAIMNAEDRDLFAVRLNEINESMAPSVAVEATGKWMSSSLANPLSGELKSGVEAAVAAASDPVHGIGFPCMIRSAYALGGLGSGICKNEEELREMSARAFAVSPQILVEKSMLGWKEVEYEVVRDVNDNCVTVCNMENFDPLGVHTGDSIVVAPSQTLDNDEYHMLRETGIKVVRHLGIVGECNIQYALHPTSKEYCIIEINPRLSRSSALASKATGYPLAFVAAKLALGHDLSVLRNSVTHTTTACFEPSLDYIVCKVPRWDLAKFDKVSRNIGSAMKSIGEVMAIGRSFEEAFQKALRMTDPAISGFDPIHFKGDPDTVIDRLYPEHDTRVHAIAEAFRQGMTVDELHDRTKIDKWFLHKLEKISSLRTGLTHLQSHKQITPTSMRGLKRSGFSDLQIGRYTGAEENAIRNQRKEMGIVPYVKQIDTMAAEFPAATNYLYMTYNGDEHDVNFEDKGSIVLGSGVYRIGSSVEFDWCSVSAIRTLRKLGRKSVMINYNPETVSTDFDECDRLYFEELSLERVQDIYEAEEAENLVVSVGGQIPNTLAMEMDAANINIVGTSPDMIDNAEDRNRFSALCDEHGIDQPQWASLTDQQAAFDFCDRVGYPVLVRPSYVLSGAAMAVAYNAGELMANLQNAKEVSAKYPVVISEFIEGGREIDVDAVAHNGKLIPGAIAIAEHVENAGVHSGDATLMMPPQTLSASDMAKTRETVDKVASALNITGPFNMQLIAKDGSVKIIETNLRASRSFPFSSKTIGTDLIEVATRAMMHKPGDPPIEPVNSLINFDVNVDGSEGGGPFVGIKSPMFSWKRLIGADPTLGVEMASTGEVACYGENKHDAFLKSLLSATFQLPQQKKVLVSIEKTLRADFTNSLELLHQQGYELYATEETAAFINDHTELPVTMLNWLGSTESPNIEEACRKKEIDLVLMFANSMSRRTEMNYEIRRLVSDFNIPLITNLQVAELFAEATQKLSTGEIKLEPLHLKEHYAKAGRSE